MQKIDAWCWLNKKADMSSMQALAKLKYKISQDLNIHHKHIKVGHAGTLDPFATGVLPVAIGQASKFIHLFLDISKQYKFTVKFGEQTDTDDNTGKIIHTVNYIPTKIELENILPQFIGKIQQIPPRYSAILIDGVRAYKTARQDSKNNISELESTLKLQSREVEIYSLKLLDYDINLGIANFHVHCGKGMYVRSLAMDISKAVGTVGHVTELTRTAYGPIELQNTSTLEQPKLLPLESIVTLENIINFFPNIELNPEQANSLLNGISVIKEKNILEDNILSGMIASESIESENIESERDAKSITCIGMSDNKIIGLVNVKKVDEKHIKIYSKRMLANE